MRCLHFDEKYIYIYCPSNGSSILVFLFRRYIEFNNTRIKYTRH